MAKKPPPMAKPCIFCPRPKGSKEHFWPEWMHAILPQSETARFNRVTHTYSPFEGSNTKGRENTQGQIHTVRFRVVCEKCNSAWMSALEQAAKPYLTSMILGEPVTLDRAALEIVARWITLKVMVAEHGDAESAATPRADRMAFKRDGLIPAYMSIYVASHDLPFEKSIGYMRNSQAIALNRYVPSPPMDDVPNNVQTVTYYLGHVFVHVTSSRVDGFKLEDIALIPKLYDNARIWPAQRDEMSWPSEPVFTLDQVNAIASSMSEALNAQDMRWYRKAPFEGAGAPGSIERSPAAPEFR